MVAGGEEDGAGVVADEALSETSAGRRVVEDDAGGEDAGGEGVAVALGPQPLHGGEHRFTQLLRRPCGSGSGRGWRGVGCAGARHVGGSGAAATAVGATGGRHGRQSLRIFFLLDWNRKAAAAAAAAA